jgi:hypothetical protein
MYKVFKNKYQNLYGHWIVKLILMELTLLKNSQKFECQIIFKLII